MGFGFKFEEREKPMYHGLFFVSKEKALWQELLNDSSDRRVAMKKIDSDPAQTDEDNQEADTKHYDRTDEHNRIEPRSSAPELCASVYRVSKNEKAYGDDNHQGLIVHCIIFSWNFRELFDSFYHKFFASSILENQGVIVLSSR
jgi:hypothetical protein